MFDFFLGVLDFFVRAIIFVLDIWDTICQFGGFARTVITGRLDTDPEIKCRLIRRFCRRRRNVRSLRPSSAAVTAPPNPGNGRVAETTRRRPVLGAKLTLRLQMTDPERNRRPRDQIPFAQLPSECICYFGGPE
jgi:hypothetical protein